MGLFGNNDTVKTTFVAVDQMTPNVKKMRSSLDEFKRGIMQGFGIGAGFGVFEATAKGIGMVTDFMGQSLTAASDLAEQTSKNTVIFGDNADEVLRWARSLDASYGLSERAALTFTGTVGNLATSMGLSSDQAADMSRELAELAGDLASFNNVDIKEVITALQSGLVGETEPMRRFGATLSAARVEAYAFANGLTEAVNVGGRIKRVVTESGKVQARYALILQDTKNAQGDAARTADSLAGKQRQFNAEWEDFTTALGEFLVGPATEFTGFLTAVITSFKPHNEAVQSGIDYINRYGQAVKEAAGEGEKLASELEAEAVQQYADAWRDYLDVNMDVINQQDMTGRTLQMLRETSLGLARATGQSVETLTVLALRVQALGGDMDDFVIAMQGLMGENIDLKKMAMRYVTSVGTMSDAIDPDSPDGPAAATREATRSMLRSMKSVTEPWKSGWQNLADWARDPFTPSKFENWIAGRARKAAEKAEKAAENGRPGVARRWRRIAAVMRNPILAAMVDIGVAVDDAVASLLALETIGNRLDGILPNIASVFGNDNDGGKKGGKKGGKRNGGGGGGGAHQPSTGTNAMGGYLGPGERSLVGENGPEIIEVAGGGGLNVTPNHRMGQPINVYVDGQRLFRILDARTGRAVAMGG